MSEHREVPTVDHLRPALEAALDEALASVVARVRAAAADPSLAGAPVPGSSWTLAETVAHLATLHRRAISDLRRSSTPEETAALNATCLDEVAERDLAALADRLVADGATAHANLRALPADLAFPFHAGTTTTVVPAEGVVLSEYLVHGWELARALGVEPVVDDDHALLALEAMGPLVGGWHRPGPPLAVAFDVGGGRVVRVVSTPSDISLEVAADVLESERPLPIAPGALLLAFPFGRTPLPEGARALAGRLAPV